MDKKNLEREVFFNLVNLYNRLVNEISVLIESFGITIHQFDILDTIRNSKKNGLPLSKIGERLRSRKPDVTRIVDRLEALGLVMRVRDTKDRRVVFVKLTKKGFGVLEGVDPFLNEIHSVQFNGLSRKELEAFNNFLIKNNNFADTLEGKRAATK